MTEREDLAAVWGRRPEASIARGHVRWKTGADDNCFLDQVAPKTERRKD